jgi:hypothetical protein
MIWMRLRFAPSGSRKARIMKVGQAPDGALLRSPCHWHTARVADTGEIGTLDFFLVKVPAAKYAHSYPRSGGGMTSKLASRNVR